MVPISFPPWLGVKMTLHTVNDMMAAYADDAVEFARRKFGIALDYTISSVEQVEFMAEQLRQTRPKGIVAVLLKKAASDYEIQTICKMLGGYVGEVYRRTKGGEWSVNQELQAVGVNQGTTWIFPQAKVHKRLVNGDEDSIWSYFNVLLSGP